MLKKIFRLVFFIVVTVFVLGVYFDPELYENITQTSINIREKPSIDSKVIGKFEPLRFALDLKTEEKWSFVFTDFKFGYVSSNLLTNRIFSFKDMGFDKKYLPYGFVVLLFLFLLKRKIAKPKIPFKRINQTADKKQQTPKNTQSWQKPVYNEYKPDHQSSQKTVHEKLERQDELSPKEKGDQFEKFIVQKFGSKNEYFKIKAWRSDKITKQENGNKNIYPEDSKYPDLEVSFQLGGNQQLFSVECKWRKRFTKGEVCIGEPYKLNNYKQYAKDKNLPVFIVIGIGGFPSKPEQLFIVPLDDFHTNVISSEELKKYQKKPVSGAFFFDRKKLTLS